MATCCAGYIRVSSRSQNLATQKHAIVSAARARGHTIRAWYSEKASASKISRPELERLLNDARAGRVKRLYVYRLDRLCRTGMRDMLNLIKELEHAGCHVETVADGFSLQGPAADVVIAMIAWGAELERLAIGERISASRKRVEAAGKHWGRPKRVTDPTVLAKVFALKKKKKTVREIAIALKIPRSTVHNLLSEKGASKPPIAKTAKRAPNRIAARVAK